MPRCGQIIDSRDFVAFRLRDFIKGKIGRELEYDSATMPEMNKARNVLLRRPPFLIKRGAAAPEAHLARADR